MNEQAKEFVRYHPPKSVSFGHQSRKQDPRIAWTQVKSFLAKWTRHSLHDELTFQCELPSARQDKNVVEAFYEFVREELGAETDPQWRLWKLPAQEMERAINVCFGEFKWPRQPIGPASLSFYVDFDWLELQRDPSVPPMTAGNPRSETSMLGLHFGTQRLFLQPKLVFPRPWTSQELISFIARIESDLPFRLRSQYFARMLPTKKEQFATRKLPSEWIESQLR